MTKHPELELYCIVIVFLFSFSFFHVVCSDIDKVNSYRTLKKQ